MGGNNAKITERKETSMCLKNQDKLKIEEMARDICRVKQNCNDVCYPINSCRALKYAERFYDAGYRKQSEWEWIFNRGRTYGEPAYYCSNCSEGASDYGYDKFCPNCGAKMKGESK